MILAGIFKSLSEFHRGIAPVLDDTPTGSVACPSEAVCGKALTCGASVPVATLIGGARINQTSIVFSSSETIGIGCESSGTREQVDRRGVLVASRSATLGVTQRGGSDPTENLTGKNSTNSVAPELCVRLCCCLVKLTFLVFRLGGRL